MVYQKLSNEQLEEFPYPNLIAELIESGYSICTLGNHMGLGGGREQNDPEVWRKLRGEDEILAFEGLGLAGLFGVKMEYLFSKKLSSVDGKTAAYLRWYDFNMKREREYQDCLKRDEINQELRSKPYMLDFVRRVLDWNKEELKVATTLLMELKTA